jgi:hypothetical protein
MASLGYARLMAVRHPRPPRGGLSLQGDSVPRCMADRNRSVRRGPRARTFGVAAVAAVALLAGTLPDRVSRAQPAQDLARAKELYQLAERAMKDGRFDDAVRDYGASYELSKDPALFFKIGRANEGAGRCDVALSYYARYLRDGKPTEQYAATTRERIRACGGDASAGAPPSPDGSAGSATGSAARPGDSASPSGGQRPGSSDAGSGARPGDRGNATNQRPDTR